MSVWPTYVGDARADFAADVAEFAAWVDDSCGARACRPLTYFARPDEDGGFVLTLAVQTQASITLKRLRLRAGQHMVSRADRAPALSVFEREMAESCGVPFDGHPWMKPVRFDSGRLGDMASYPFFRAEGKEVHEVAVGPIHAGVIEPGHFRFMCHGERVVHLEIHLGYQHRGVTELVRRRDLLALAPLLESVAGDSSVAHAWAYAQALEQLCGTTVTGAIPWARGIGLELERIAMHLVGLAGLCTDVGFLPGGATFGRLRTTIINSTMLACGSRFGRGWVRPGTSRVALGEEVRNTLLANLASFSRDFEGIVAHFESAASVRRRLSGTGILTAETAALIGVVGFARRASGGALDQRTSSALYGDLGWKLQVLPSGDCLARAGLRILEIRESLTWLQRALGAPARDERGAALSSPRASKLVLSLVEGFRGECVHCVETGAEGQLVDYRIQDPSLLNWFGLALAVRDNPIYDFPICNKSFDLSYCGNDL